MPAPVGDLDYNAGIDKGAIGWNNVGAGVSFGKLRQNGCVLGDKNGLVTVEIYTSPDNPCLPPGAPPNTPYLACVLPVIDQLHRTTQTLYINGDEAWASDADGDRSIARSEYYLPAVMTHEFGHTAGLGHSANLNDLMYSNPSDRLIKRVVNTLPANDVSAMKSLYQSHTSH